MSDTTDDAASGSGRTDRTALEALLAAPSRTLASVAGATGAVVAALPLSTDSGSGSGSGSESESELESESGSGSTGRPAHEDRVDPGGTHREGSVEAPDASFGSAGASAAGPRVSVGTSDSVEVGDRVAFTKTVSEADVHRFARASGDRNPLHLDAEYAGGTRFDGRIVHGTLVSGLVSAALARLPGVVVVLSREETFRAPVHVGDRVTADAEVVEALGDDRYRLRTTVSGTDGAVRLDGEVAVLVDSPPDE